MRPMGPMGHIGPIAEIPLRDRISGRGYQLSTIHYQLPVKLLLVDGHYYVYRSFFAIRELANSNGEPTNAIYGFIKTLRRMVKDLAPDAGAVLWDRGMPKRRVELQPA